MKGCSHCEEFKKMLVEKNIDFFDRDIDEHEEEYDTFSEITGSEYIPALLIIEGNQDNYESFLYTPDKDYDKLTEAVEIINKHRKSVGIL